MAKLNAVVENLDDVPEAMRDYYNETQDADKKVWFVLQLDDDVKNHPTVIALQRAHERQKQDYRTTDHRTPVLWSCCHVVTLAY